MWTDDEQLAGGAGGKVYETYGISPEQGAVVVVRPDGYVSAITALDDVDHLNQYFAGFMRAQT